MSFCRIFGMRLDLIGVMDKPGVANPWMQLPKTLAIFCDL